MNTIITSKPLRGLLVTTILGAVSAGLATVATAADFDDVRSVTVRYADLNPSNPQGAAELYRRIVTAAREVCGFDSNDLTSQKLARPCVNRAIADAVTKVGDPELFGIYNAQTHRALPITITAAR